MGKRGPKPKTSSQKLAQGYGAASSESTKLAPPGDLKGEALKEWDRIVTALEESGRLRAVQFSSIRAAAKAWGQLEKLMRQFARSKATYQSGGLTKINPLIKVINTFEVIHRARLEKLGLTAGMMARGGGDVPAKQDKAAGEEKDKRPVLRMTRAV